jgi:hypothetical protein
MDGKILTSAVAKAGAPTSVTDVTVQKQGCILLKKTSMYIFIYT